MWFYILIQRKNIKSRQQLQVCRLSTSQQQCQRLKVKAQIHHTRQIYYWWRLSWFIARRWKSFSHSVWDFFFFQDSRLESGAAGCGKESNETGEDFREMMTRLESKQNEIYFNIVWIKKKFSGILYGGRIWNLIRDVRKKYHFTLSLFDLTAHPQSRKNWTLSDLHRRLFSWSACACDV